jgi:effector-binding domain-containing protein
LIVTTPADAEADMIGGSMDTVALACVQKEAQAMLDDAESIGRVRPYHSAEVEVATIVHAGSHRNIDLAYGALATHVARCELAADGPLREHYLVGPLDTSDEITWRTEIGWPIVKVAERPD